MQITNSMIAMVATVFAVPVFFFARILMGGRSILALTMTVIAGILMYSFRPFLDLGGLIFAAVVIALVNGINPFQKMKDFISRSRRPASAIADEERNLPNKPDPDIRKALTNRPREIESKHHKDRTETARDDTT